MSPVPEKIDVLWFLPTHGDSRYLGTSIGGRNVDLNYLKQVAQAADTLGYFGVLIPTGRSCEDSWIVASALAPLTEKLRYLVAVRPGLLSPTLAARMTATLDRISNGRLLINVVTGGDPIENKGDGIHYSHEERYEVTEEFINIYKAVLRGEDVTTKSSISISRMPNFCSSRSRTRTRRSISAAPPVSASRSPPARSTNT